MCVKRRSECEREAEGMMKRRTNFSGEAPQQVELEGGRGRHASEREREKERPVPIEPRINVSGAAPQQVTSAIPFYYCTCSGRAGGRSGSVVGRRIRAEG